MLKALNPSVQRFSSVLHLSEQEIVVAVKKTCYSAFEADPVCKLLTPDQYPREIMFRVLGEVNHDHRNTLRVSYFSQVCGWTIFALNFNILVVNQTLLESCTGGQPSLLTGNLQRNLSDFTLCCRRAVYNIKQQGPQVVMTAASIGLYTFLSLPYPVHCSPGFSIGLSDRESQELASVIWICLVDRSV